MVTTELFKPLANIQAPNQDQMTKSASSALAMVQSMQITDAETYELAADELKGIKTRAKALEDQRQTIVAPLNKATKAVNDMFRGPTQFLEQAERIIKQKMIDFTTIQERIAKEAQRKADEQRQAEQARLAAEAAQREEEARKQSEILQDEAKAAEQAGDVGRAAEAAVMAEQVIASAVQESIALETTAAAMSVPVVAAPAKVSGVSKPKVAFKAKVIDKAAFLAFVATRPEMLEMIDVNESKLNAMAKALKTSMNYPGIEVYEEKTLAVRA